MPLNSKHVSIFLKEKNIRGAIVQLNKYVTTVEVAAQALGVSPESIVKSVVFMADAEPVLVIINGTTCINVGRLADYLGIAKKHIRLADASTILERTGFRVGSVPPFGHKTRLRTLVDKRVLAQSEIYAGGGAAKAIMRIAPADIVSVTNAEIICLAGEA